MPDRLFVLVAGWPGSGKSTLAAALPPVLAMLRVVGRCPGAVLDSTWFGYALPLAQALPGRLVAQLAILNSAGY